MKHYHLQASPHSTGVDNSSCSSITVSATNNKNNNLNGTNTTNTSSNDNFNNYSDDKRDSAYWSIGSIGDASKHTSVTSAHMSNPISSPMGAYHHDKPTPLLNNAPVRSLVSPTSNNGMSVASLVSPTTTTSSSGNMDERMLGMLNRGQSDASARSSYVSTDSRRDSVDNRSINTAINDMKLNPAPIPFPNNIPSTTSIQATLQSQRDPRNGPERLSASRFPSGLSGIDLSKRSGPRTAPAITGVTPSQYANNPTPIVGQAWAGFDVDDHARAAPSIAGSSRHTSYMDSRRGSVAESFASTASQMTTESSLPHGQRRLGDPYSNNYMGRDHGSIDANTHHHQLKNKQLEDIRDEDGGSPGIGVQPYSRTPELRVSHKLAERKRRDEMKTLYDTLRELMPQERGNKASKWEILSKAISEHKMQLDSIRRLTHANQQMDFDMQALRRENAQLREELTKSRGYQSSGTQQHSSNPQGQTNSNYSTSDYGRGQSNRTDLARVPDLPPPRLLEPSLGNSDSMSGVQYHASPSNGLPLQPSYRHDSLYASRM